MNLSALDKTLATIESQISGIEQYVDSLEKWLWLSSLAVIIGVALEVYFVVNQYREEREAWGRGFVRPPDRPSPWLLAVEVASIILVVAGIVGELGIGILSSNSNAKLRTLNNSRLDLVRQQATDAVTQAGDAKQSATQARDAAASAVSSAASARKEADSFEKDIASSKEQLLMMSARYKLIRKGEAEFIKAIEAFPGQQVELQLCRALVDTDNETGALYQSLVDLLSKAKWEI